MTTRSLRAAVHLRVFNRRTDRPEPEPVSKPRQATRLATTRSEWVASTTFMGSPRSRVRQLHALRRHRRSLIAVE